jgi:hypothetical protein
MAVLPAQHNMSLMRKLTGHVLLERLRCSGAIVCAFPSRWPMDHSKGCGYSFNLSPLAALRYDNMFEGTRRRFVGSRSEFAPAD